MRKEDIIFGIIVIFLLFFAGAMVFYKIEVGTTIAITMALFSVASLFYANYRNSKDLLFQLNYKDMKKSALMFKYYLKKIISEYNTLSKNNNELKNYAHFKDYFIEMNFLMYEIEQNNNFLSNEELKEKKKKWANICNEILGVPEEGIIYNYDKNKFVAYPNFLNRLIFNINQMKDNEFYDNLPSDMQIEIEKLKDFICNAEKEYLKSSNDKKMGRDIINEIEGIISNLNLQNINKIIRNDFIN